MGSFEEYFTEISNAVLAVLYFLLFASAIVLQVRIKKKMRSFKELGMLTVSYLLLCFMRGAYFVLEVIELQPTICLPLFAEDFLMQFPTIFIFEIYLLCLDFWGEVYYRAYDLDPQAPLLLKSAPPHKKRLKICLLVCGSVIAVAFLSIIVWDGILVKATTVCSFPLDYNAPGDAYMALSAALHALSLPGTFLFVYYVYKTVSQYEQPTSKRDLKAVNMLALLTLGILGCFLLRSAFLFVFLPNHPKWILSAYFQFFYWALLEVLPLTLMQLLFIAPISPALA